MTTSHHSHRLLVRSTWLICAALVLAAVSTSAFAQPAEAGLASRHLIGLLRAGGYVIVMRHAQSPLARPSANAAAPGNTRRERQLSPVGIATAKAIGAALRVLRIPIGPIYASPAFRARETIRFAGLRHPILVPQLAEGAHGMGAPVRRSRARWLRNAVRRPPPAGTNTLIVTHTPNIVGAFGAAAARTVAAEMLVFKPNHHHRARLIGHITPREWHAFARPLHRATGHGRD